MQIPERFNGLSHWELVEFAERLMNEMPDSERFLPDYDAALSAETDLRLVVFCGHLKEIAAGSFARLAA